MSLEDDERAVSSGGAAIVSGGNDNGSRTVRHNPKVLRQTFVTLLDEYGTEVQSERVRSTLGTSLIKQTSERETRIRLQLASEFSVVVMGDFKRGKSTLINALLGQTIVTMDVTPETVTINELRYGPELKAEARLDDGREVDLRPEELHRDVLEGILGKLPKPVSQIRIQAPVETLRGICLVDTPGTGDLLLRFDMAVRDYLWRSDVVIYLVSALSPLSESEQTFLRTALLPQDFPKVFFVINMMDFARNERDAERLLGHVGEKIQRQFPKARIFGLSALDELCRLSRARPVPERATALEAQFAEFRQALDECLSAERDYIKLDRAVDQAERMVADAENAVRLLRDSIQADRGRLDQAIAAAEDQSSDANRRLAEARKSLAAEIGEMGEQAQGWMDEFVSRLHADALAAFDRSSLEEIQTFLHYFVVDSLREAISQCVFAHEPRMAQAVSRVRNSLAVDARQLTVGVTAQDSLTESVAGVTLAHQPNTAIQSIHEGLELFSLNQFSLGALGAVSKLLLGKSEEAKSLKHYRQALAGSADTLRESTAKVVRNLYVDLASELDKQLAEDFRRDLDNAVSAMRQARDLGVEGERNLAVAKATIDQLLPYLADVRSSLDTLGSQLWSEDLLGVPTLVGE